ncbi:MAG TPA: hypothetical protein DCW41_06830 [Clostridiales bacterium]|nr:hypothetical protein [Clostridiales bacterium]
MGGGKLTYTSAFAGAVTEIAARNKKVVGISAAMAQGTGMDKFAFKFPERFFDCGIAEEHAVTMAGGLAVSGFVPAKGLRPDNPRRMLHEPPCGIRHRQGWLRR